MAATNIVVDSVDNGWLVVPFLPTTNNAFDRLVYFLVQNLGGVGNIIITIAELIGLISDGRDRSSCCGRDKEKTNQL